MDYSKRLSELGRNGNLDGIDQPLKTTDSPTFQEVDLSAVVFTTQDGTKKFRLDIDNEGNLTTEEVV